VISHLIPSRTHRHSGVPQLQSATKAPSTKERVRNRSSVKFGITWKLVWGQRRFWLQRVWPSAMVHDITEVTSVH